MEKIPSAIVSGDNMLPSATKLILLSTSFVALSWLASSAARADDIGNANPPKRAVASHHIVKKPMRPTAVAVAKLDCSPMIYEYGGKTETKTVCSPPWTGPASEAEQGPSGSSSSSSQ